jgi:type II secretory pathway component PulF
MTAFRYEAARLDGATVRGVLDADSSAEAATVLSGRGLFPLAVEPQRERPVWRFGFGSARAQATVFESLASLVDAGVPLEKALRATEAVATGGLRPALARIGTRVREGSSLGAALGSEAGLFSGITIGLVRGGERGVGLGPALAQAAAQLEREAETMARMRGALAYPLLLAAVGTGSVALIVTFVVPRFVALLGDLGQTLPLATRVLISASNFARHYGVLLVGISLVVAVLALRAVRERRIAWHHWLLGLPVIGPIRHGLASGRVCRTLAALLGNGTPALGALAIAEDAAGDAAVADRLRRTRDRVSEGVPLSAALSSTGAITAGSLQLMTIGESSGRLAPLLAKAALLEEREAERRLKTILTFLEPGLILLFAGLVAFVAAALLQAVYSLRPGGL